MYTFVPCFHTFTRSNVILLRGKLVVLSQDGYILYMFVTFINYRHLDVTCHIIGAMAASVTHITYTVITSSLYSSRYHPFGQGAIQVLYPLHVCAYLM